jgi:sugar/nucleoside kinase (ribokinase family)
MRHFSIIGAAHLDALVEGIDEPVVREGSHAAGQIRLSFGGDALNEAVTLSRLGGKVDLVSKVGDDSGGDMALAYCRYQPEYCPHRYGGGKKLHYRPAQQPSRADRRRRFALC